MVIKRNAIRRMIGSLAMLFAMTAGTNAVAQSSDEWQVEVTPYLWLTALKGDTQIGAGPVAKTDMSATDVLNILDFGLMGALEARKGRWSVLLDGMYAKLSDSAGKSATLQNGVSLVLNADVTIKQAMYAGALGYRAIEGRSPVDVVFGLRYTDLDIETSLSAAAIGILGVTRSPSYQKSWVDPYVGARIIHPIADQWSLVGYADVGGFGAGSKETWQVVVGANYEWSKTKTIKFGYRHLYQDFDRDNFRYKMETSGMYAGLGMRF